MLKPLSLGIISGLGTDPRERLRLIRDLGLTHFQWTYGAELDTPDGLAAIAAASAECGLEITTVFCGYAGESYADIPTVRRTVGLVPIATRAARLETTRRIAMCAHELGVARVALHIGFIPEDATDADYLALVELTRDLADELAAREQLLAFETGQETAATLRRFLEDVERDNLRVNFDPANMILYGNDNPLEALPLLAPWIDEVHCKDGRWPTQSDQLGHETRFGEGDVDVKRWLEALLATGFRGPLTIEREIGGSEQIADVRASIALIQSLLGTQNGNFN